MIDRGVVRNLVDPGGEFELRAITRQRVIYLNKNFLCQVERRVIIADHAIDVGCDGPLVSAHQLLERRFPSGQGTLNQFAIGQGANFSNRNRCAHRCNCFGFTLPGYGKFHAENRSDRSSRLHISLFYQASRARPAGAAIVSKAKFPAGITSPTSAALSGLSATPNVSCAIVTTRCLSNQSPTNNKRSTEALAPDPIDPERSR